VSGRRTRIVCTIGPASADAAGLAALAAAGMDVARLNFSHGTHESHAAVIRRLRETEESSGRPLAILQDLQGPRLRLGTFGEGGGGRVDLEAGQAFALARTPCVGTAERVAVAPAEYLSELRVGDEVWMDDGQIQLRVDRVAAGEVRCRVVAGGRLSDHKGVSLPSVALPASCLTPKDRADLRFGIAHDVDFVAVSFVRTAADVAEVRACLAAEGAPLPLVAKLERAEALVDLPDILAGVDGVMVARGDLGVEMPLEEVPHIQKEIVRQARAAKVPVIVATQMLESMVTHLRPTRAEVADVTAAIFDGADAVMLSAETATGRHPARAVEVMARVAERAERAVLADATRHRRPGRVGVDFPEAVAEAAAGAAHALGARAIVAFTQSGFSARLISQARPEVPIIAFTPSPAVRRRLALSWGVTSRLIRKVETTDEVVDEIERALLGDGSVQPGDALVIISGSPMWVTGTTNLMKLHRVGERR
jgi:pyruvate kinase